MRQHTAYLGGKYISPETKVYHYYVFDRKVISLYLLMWDELCYDDDTICDIADSTLIINPFLSTLILDVSAVVIRLSNVASVYPRLQIEALC
jgi:hypothetical protein